jgi:hypothetical protein
MTHPRPVPAVEIPPVSAEPVPSWGAASMRLDAGGAAPDPVAAIAAIAARGAASGLAIASPTPHDDAIPAIATDPAPVADTLRAAGFVRAATAIARIGDDARLAEWEAIATADAALADVLATHGAIGVPSVQLGEDGAPRFVVCGDDMAALVDGFRQEHEGSGVDAELRLFLDEALQPGDRYVDAAPGAGWAVLTAATRPGVRAIALVDDARAARAIATGARASRCAGAVTVRDLDAPDAFALAPADGVTVLHAGRAADVAPLLQALRAAHGTRLDVVAWRCGAAHDADHDAEGMQVAAAVLGVLGFRHFALAAGEQGVELVPAEAMASNTMIFSLGEGFLARAGA